MTFVFDTTSQSKLVNTQRYGCEKVRRQEYKALVLENDVFNIFHNHSGMVCNWQCSCLAKAATVELQPI